MGQVVHAVVFKSGDCWVAQCLEYDIATQAGSFGGLLRELERILAAHVLADPLAPFAGIPAAPTRFWELYGPL